MKSEKNIKLYIGLGSAFLTVISFLLIRKLLKRKQNEAAALEAFDYSIFDSPDANGSGACIANELVLKLKLLEERTGYPVFDWITSGVRTPYWNRKVGGVSNSSHLTSNCTAVDIGISTLNIRNQLVLAAKEVGFTRIGVANTFVHLDVDPDKPQYVAWGYPAGTPPAINPFV
ncbi:D-Ala-D-Ala carboxypeptidase family metallohydrolase [Aquimarina agarilytica]|uniref:D-Ala-D-Ala carboxypeptidase family metallohydrolase n=1 Tax=Aquimarina agarilytica TaxID=1087449 RepID=UPI0002887897|nr:D-Ala-D-Ala carboxypeptidase family metallohydrolase [Aquimarina agarilytica]